MYITIESTSDVMLGKLGSDVSFTISHSMNKTGQRFH